MLVGQLGENLAQGYLEQHGYIIVARNWRYGRHGEIDLIACDVTRGHLAFVEVKTRRSTRYGSPLEAVTARKQATIRLIAEAYLADPLPLPVPMASVSFDVIAVMTGNPPDILHIPCAF